VHPYAGNPSNDPVSVSIPDDGVDAPSFGNIMTSVEGLADKIAALKQQVALVGLANWKPQVKSLDPGPILSGAVDPGTVYLAGGAWDPLQQRWVCAFINSTGDQLTILATHSSGDFWIGVDGPIVNLNILHAMASDTAGNTLVAYNTLLGGVPTSATEKYDAAGTAHPSNLHPYFDNVKTAVAIWYSGGWYLIGADQTGGNYVGHAGSSADAITWADASSSLPGSFAAGTATVTGFVYDTDPSGSSPAPMLVGMCTAGSPGSKIMQFPSAVDVTPAILATRRLSGIAYNSVRGLWGLLCEDGAGVYLYTSPDQVTWTLTKTFQALVAGGLAAIGAVWAVQLTTVDIGGFPSGYNRVVLSPDNGATWTTASYELAGNGVPGFIKLPGILKSSGVQLLAYNNQNHDFSHVARFMPAGGF
jgi:hypothetical protein